MLPAYVLLDLETTGSSPERDRITEIAALRIEGGREVARWQTLVQPGLAIPPFIQRLTGIDDALLEGAPPFARVAPALLAVLSGAVLVAHNARFDHGFLLAECARAGLPLSTRTLCSVRLSRALEPGERAHGLDALIARHGLQTDARHRAMGDVDVLWQWLQGRIAAQGLEAVRAAAQRQLAGSAALPAQLQTDLRTLTDGPGVYLMYGEAGALLYVGKSVRVRSRVMAHFQASLRDAREMRLAQAVHTVEARPTAGELGALLLEARLVKQQQPLFNRQLRRSSSLCAWCLSDDPAQRPLLQLGRAGASGWRATQALYGPYRSRHQALARLRELCDRHRLCPQALGLESGRGACFAHQLGRCDGVCAGLQAPEQHLARVRAALASDALAAWPWAGVVGVFEHHADSGRSAWHLFDHWCHLASVRDEAELADALARRDAPPLAFDLDTYRIALRVLLGPHPLHASLRVFTKNTL